MGAATPNEHTRQGAGVLALQQREGLAPLVPVASKQYGWRQVF